MTLNGQTHSCGKSRLMDHGTHQKLNGYPNSQLQNVGQWFQFLEMWGLCEYSQGFPRQGALNDSWLLEILDVQIFPSKYPTLKPALLHSIHVYAVARRLFGVPSAWPWMISKCGVLWQSVHAGVGVGCIRVDKEVKSLWKTYRNFVTLFRTIPSRPSMVSPSPRLGFAPHPKLQSLLSHYEWVKLQISNFTGTFAGSIKIFEKKEHGRIQGQSNFLGVPLVISGTGRY